MSADPNEPSIGKIHIDINNRFTGAVILSAGVNTTATTGGQPSTPTHLLSISTDPAAIPVADEDMRLDVKPKSGKCQLKLIVPFMFRLRDVV